MTFAHLDTRSELVGEPALHPDPDDLERLGQLEFQHLQYGGLTAQDYRLPALGASCNIDGEDPYA